MSPKSTRCREGSTRRALERPKGGDAAAHACGAAHEPEEQPDEQQHRSEAQDHRPARRAILVDRLSVDHDALAPEQSVEAIGVREGGHLGVEVGAGRGARSPPG
jgi:hypothetical protein